MWWLVENFANAFRERKMEIMTDFSNLGVWTYTDYTLSK